MTREEINARLDELSGGISYLAAFDELDAEQRTQWDEGIAEFEALEVRAADIALRNAAADRAIICCSTPTEVERSEIPMLPGC